MEEGIREFPEETRLISKNKIDMEKLVLKVVNKSKNPLPEYASEGSSGMDVRAYIDNEEGKVIIHPGETILVPTGLYYEIPVGYEIQVRSRSGLALKYGIIVLNSPGTIDADYRGEVGVILHNCGGLSYIVSSGDRIAQLVVCKTEKPEVMAVSKLDDTERGDGGFGHSGVK